jgi:tetratricopeptide (TPR) repeat protein
VSIVRWCGADDPAGARGLEEEERKIPANADEIVKVFPDYLSRLAFRVKQKSVRGVIVLDALNQLEDRKRGRLLAWLLYRLPGELRLIVSTLPGDTLTALQPRGWPALTVEPLTPDECVHLIARYLAHFSQGLSEARARKIAASPASSNPLYIKTLLDDLRATGENRRIDQQIDDYLQAADIPALFGKILTRFERDYERDRPGLVREALSLLWAARRGLTETELLAALRSAGQERLPAAIWSPVRCALEDGLLDRDGVLAFAHEHLRTAVERRYVSEAGAGRSLRLRLADDFAGRPVDARQADELPWLLRQAESRDRLRACLLDIDRFLLMQKRDENEILGYWVWLKEERAMGQPYVQAFERWSGGKGETADVTYAASQVAGFLSFRGALYADAEPLLRQALAACVRMLGSNHPITLMTVNRLAVLLEKRGAYTAAQPLYERALAIREQVWGPEHPNTLTSLNNLAGLREIKSDYAAAQPLYERALTASERVLGPEHPDTIRCVSNLACLLMVNGDYVTALPLFERALAVSERVLGPEHSDTMTRVSNLAGLLARKGDYASARSLYERALTTSEQVLGPEHPLVATSLSNLAGLLQATNHPAEAEPLMRRALLINEQCYGPCHPDFAKMLNNLAHLLKTTGRSEEAEPLMRRALEIDQATYGPRHPDVALRLNNLAALLLATGRTTEAEHLARESLAMYEGIYAEGHPTVALALNTLAELLRGNGRFSEAEPLYRRALSIDERSVGPAHPDVAADLNNLALLLCATKRVPEAEPLLRRALDIDERCYGPDHPDVAGDLHTLASLLWDGNRLAEAEPLMRRGLEIYLQFTATNGREHPRLRLTLNNYVNLLRTRGDPQERVSACVCALAAKFGVTVCGS